MPLTGLPPVQGGHERAALHHRAPPGNYTVLARRIGYRTTQATAAVRIDATRDINFQLSSSGATLSAVKVVTQQRPSGQNFLFGVRLGRVQK